MHEDLSNHQLAFEHETERDSIQNHRVREANGLINEYDNEQEFRSIIKVEGEELEIYLTRFCRIWNTVLR